VSLKRLYPDLKLAFMKAPRFRDDPTICRTVPPETYALVGGDSYSGQPVRPWTPSVEDTGPRASSSDTRINPGVRPWAPTVLSPPHSSLPVPPPSADDGMETIRRIMDHPGTSNLMENKETQTRAADALFGLGKTPPRPMDVDQHGAEMVARQQAETMASVQPKTPPRTIETEDVLKNLGFDSTKMLGSPSLHRHYWESIPTAVGPVDVEDPAPMAVGPAENYEPHTDHSEGRPSSVASDSTWASHFDAGIAEPQPQPIEPKPMPMEPPKVIEPKPEPMGPPQVLGPSKEESVKPPAPVAPPISMAQPAAPPPKEVPVQSPRLGMSVEETKTKLKPLKTKTQPAAAGMRKVPPVVAPKIKAPSAGIVGKPALAMKPPPAMKTKPPKPPGPPAWKLSPAKAKIIIETAESIGVLPVDEADAGAPPPDIDDDDDDDEMPQFGPFRMPESSLLSTQPTETAPLDLAPPSPKVQTQKRGTETYRMNPIRDEGDLDLPPENPKEFNSYQGGHLNCKFPRGYSGCMWENIPAAPRGHMRSNSPLVGIGKNIVGILRHGNDPDLPRIEGHDYHHDHRVCGTSLTDEKFRAILRRGHWAHPAWRNVNVDDPRQFTTLCAAYRSERSAFKFSWTNPTLKYASIGPSKGIPLVMPIPHLRNAVFNRLIQTRYLAATTIQRKVICGDQPASSKRGLFQEDTLVISGGRPLSAKMACSARQ